MTTQHLIPFESGFFSARELEIGQELPVLWTFRPPLGLVLADRPRNPRCWGRMQ